MSHGPKRPKIPRSRRSWEEVAQARRAHGTGEGNKEVKQGSLFGGPTKRLDLDPDEFSITCTIADTMLHFLNRDWQFSHFPAGEYRPTATGGRLKRMGVATGWPDFILLAPTGRAHFMEIKRAKGRLSEPQKEFASWCVAHDIPHAVVRSFEEAVAVLYQWRALRVVIKEHGHAAEVYKGEAGGGQAQSA